MYETLRFAPKRSSGATLNQPRKPQPPRSSIVASKRAAARCTTCGRVVRPAVGLHDLRSGCTVGGARKAPLEHDDRIRSTDDRIRSTDDRIRSTDDRIRSVSNQKHCGKQGFSGSSGSVCEISSSSTVSVPSVSCRSASANRWPNRMLAAVYDARDSHVLPAKEWPPM